MTLKGTEALSAGELPQSQRIVVAAREDGAAVWTQRNGVYPVRVPLEGTQAVASGDVPQPHRPVMAPGEGEATIRAPRHRVHRARVPLEGMLHPAFRKLAVSQGARQPACQL